MRTDYNEHRTNRIESLKTRAETKSKAADEKLSSTLEVMDSIPLGQPILVGHHSEGKMRNLYKKIDSSMNKAIKMHKDAEALAQRAAAAENNNAISSDDPEAIQKITHRIETLEQVQEVMKACNKIIKNKKMTQEEKIAEMVKIGRSQKQAEELFIPDFMGDIGFPSYALSNHSANIRRLKKRKEQLEARFAQVTEEITINDIRIVKNIEANRLQMFFPSKPDEDIRKRLKSRGFRWSRNEGAWQAFISNGSVYAAKDIAQEASK